MWPSGRWAGCGRIVVESLGDHRGGLFCLSFPSVARKEKNKKKKTKRCALVGETRRLLAVGYLAGSRERTTVYFGLVAATGKRTMARRVTARRDSCFFFALFLSDFFFMLRTAGRPLSVPILPLKGMAGCLAHFPAHVVGGAALVVSLCLPEPDFALPTNVASFPFFFFLAVLCHPCSLRALVRLGPACARARA